MPNASISNRDGMKAITGTDKTGTRALQHKPGTPITASDKQYVGLIRSASRVSLGEDLY